jgi:5-methylcytosine-specific restriction endonuclease McrA
MQDGTILHPQRGTPQGGIISPLLANIVLNELDRWVESQWADNPVVYKYAHAVRKSGCEDKGTGYKAMRNTRLKEMHIVRYADDFRIFCRTKSEAQRIKIAVSQWLSDRLKLEVSPEKTRIVNAKRRYTEFLGFKIKVKSKGKKYVVRSQISDKQLVRKKQKLKAQAKRIAKPRKEFKEHGEVLLYNSMVLGTQNYYQIATHISVDCAVLYRAVMVILTNRLRTKNGTRLKKKGKPLSKFETKRYGASQMIRYVSSTGDPIYPIGYVQHKKPLNKRRDTNPYTPEGRKGLHDDLRINKFLMLTLMKEALYNRSAEYADNRISLFSAQMGKCAVTGVEFVLTSDIHCHHKVPKEKGGNDAYANLVLILKPVHKLVHAKDADTIERYKKVLALTPEQMERLNKLREIAGYAKIA